MIIFIGWSAEQDTKIYGASDKDGPNTIDKLTLTANDEVYAVWGYDANENGTPTWRKTASTPWPMTAMPSTTVIKSLASPTAEKSSMFPGRSQFWTPKNPPTPWRQHG